MVFHNREHTLLYFRRSSLPDITREINHFIQYDPFRIYDHTLQLYRIPKDVFY
jgi:hypothetical protein